LRNARVAAAMTAHGFGDADLEEGWTLLKHLSRDKLGFFKPQTSNLIDEIDAWENKWFPIASATLERRFPVLAEKLFANLPQSTRPAVIVGVQTFVERFDEMVAGGGSYGTEGAAAVAVLAARGLTAAVVDEARALLDTARRIETHAAVATMEQDQQQLAKAEEALWAWYLEWSQIARIAITQRGLLRQMGFIQGQASGKGDEEIVDETANGITPPAAPPTETSIDVHN
jgi:hypothetical protein